MNIAVNETRAAWAGPEVTRRLSRVGVVQLLPEGAVLIEEGALESHLFVLEQGTFSVRDSAGAEACTLGPGAVVGEFAFFDNRPRRATVIATSRGIARRIERQEILCALGDSPELLSELLASLAEIRRQRETEVPGSVAADRAFVEDLSRRALGHRAVRHPYLHALADAAVPDLRGALVDFAQHYYGYSAHFPRYLATVISRLDDAGHRRALLQNMTEESGNYDEEELSELSALGVDPEWIVGIPHPELFRRFQRAIGAAASQISEEALEVVSWREMFLDVLSGGSAAEAIGALGLGTETIVREIYAPLVRALEQVPELSDRDKVFFPLHTAVDDHHQETLLQIAADFAATPEGRRDLAKGMYKALALRSAFWDWLHERALAMAADTRRD